MRALVNTRAGGVDVLAVEERPDPSPGPGSVLIRVKRAGLNFADLAARVGLYPDAPKFPMVVGYEVSGVVEALGAGVSGLTTGERVVALTIFGGQASRVVVPAAQVRPIPEAMSFDEAAALPVNYLTAFHLLRYVAPLQPGMTVLIHSAAGGVGLAAIQLCRATGGIEIIGRASAGKHAMLREAGVQHTLDSHRTDYVAEVRQLTGGKGVHRVLDALGGADWAKGYSLLRPGGHLLCFGWGNMIGGQKRNLLHVGREVLSLKRFNPMDLMAKNRSVSGINLLTLTSEAELIGRHFDALLDLVRAGTVKPHVDRVFPLSRAAEAHAWLQGRKAVGKVVFDCETEP